MSGLTMEQVRENKRDKQIKELASRLDEVMARLDKIHKTPRSGRINRSDSSSSGSDTSRSRTRRQRPEYSSDENYKHRSRRRVKYKDDDKSLRLDIPEFIGSSDPEKFLDWVRRVERVFEYKEYDDRKSFKIVEMKLTGYASLWLDNLKKRRRRDERSKIVTWTQLKKHMRQKFVPEG